MNLFDLFVGFISWRM